MEPIYLKNSVPCSFGDIPVAGDFDGFAAEVRNLLSDSRCHCVNYFALKMDACLRLVMCIADDGRSETAVFSHELRGDILPSIGIIAVERFEREIAGNFGLTLSGHRWPKPLRTAPDDYPFYRSDNEEHHEVGVGPIHAGIIEPGHFRFTCEGEKILNLEIMLGYQHRGVESLMLALPDMEQKALLAEDIAGDTAVGHSVAFASAIEALSGFHAGRVILYSRTLALELERIAIHTGDLGAICGDVAYQLGNAVYGRLRTPIINFMQKWCGNRLGKTSVRPFEAPYLLTRELADDLKNVLTAFDRDFDQISRQVCHYPSVLSRLERTGTVKYDDALETGAVGMAARASGLCRDVRRSHPYLLYDPSMDTVVKRHGDVYSRTRVRMEEVFNSIALVRRLIESWPFDDAAPDAGTGTGSGLAAGSFVLSLVEGWRGEICHTAVTDGRGRLLLYKIKDPSFHNWRMLELAVRNNEISDFPICNKSFNLSYCGHDL